MNTLFNRVQIERDPNNKKIEDSVYAKLAEIVKPQEPVNSNHSNLRIVSVEDALRELLEIEKTGQGT